MKMSKRRFLLGFAAAAALVPVASGATPPASMPILDATRIAAAGGALARTLGMSVISTCGQNYSTYNPKTAASAYGQPTWSMCGITYLQQEISPISVSYIQTIHANYAPGSSLSADLALGEGPPLGMLPISATAIDLSNAASYDLTWDGSKFRDLGYSAAKSDLCPIPIVAGQWYGIATCAMPTKMSAFFTARGGFGATAGGVQVFTKSGSWPDDNTSGFLSGTGMPATSGGGFSHGLVLGYTGSNPTKTIIIVGDSNQVALGENLLGNWVTRLGLDNGNQSVTEANIGTPKYAVSNFSKQGESLRGFATPAQHQMRLFFASFHTNAIITLGANDIIAGTVSLATLKASWLSTAKLYTTMGLKVFVCTIPPIVNSTDGWRTAGNQTPLSNESTRTGGNDFLLDASASGFTAQAIANGCPAKLLQVVDLCAPFEVNSSNVLTRNGGRIIAPTGSPSHTGTVTTGGSTSSVTDSALAATVNQYRGAVIRFTSGANANTVAVITGNTASVLSLNKGITATSVGDSYELWLTDGPRYMDSVHQTPIFHIAAYQYFKANYASKVI